MIPERTPEQQAWSDAQDRRRAELNLSIQRKVSAAVGGWRLCTISNCRRRHRCSDDSFACLAIWRRNQPPVVMTQEEQALWAYNFKKEIEARLAEHEARDAEKAQRQATQPRRDARRSSR